MLLIPHTKASDSEARIMYLFGHNLNSNPLPYPAALTPFIGPGGVNPISGWNAAAEIVPGYHDDFRWDNNGILTRAPGLQTGLSCYSWTACKTAEGCMQAALLSPALLNVNKNQQPLRLSIRNGVDCCLCPGSVFVGGTARDIFYYMYRWGISSFSDYRGFGLSRQSTCRRCKVERTTRATVKISGYNDLGNYNEKDLMFAVRNWGPVAVQMTVGDVFHNCKTGNVLQNALYDASQRNGANIYGHYMVLMGYGMQNQTPFWLFRNSYGVNWGDRGYVRLSRTVTRMFESVVQPWGGYRL